MRVEIYQACFSRVSRSRFKRILNWDLFQLCFDINCFRLGSWCVNHLWPQGRLSILIGDSINLSISLSLEKSFFGCSWKEFHVKPSSQLGARAQMYTQSALASWAATTMGLPAAFLSCSSLPDWVIYSWHIFHTHSAFIRCLFHFNHTLRSCWIRLLPYAASLATRLDKYLIPKLFT